MLNTYKKLYDILDPHEKISALQVLVLLFAVAALETIGVASIMPFMAVLANPGIIEQNHLLAQLYSGLGFESARMFLAFLGLVFLFLVFSALALGALSYWAQVRFSELRNHAWSCRLIGSYLGQPYDWFMNQHSGSLGASVLHETDKAIHGVLFPAVHVVARGLVVLFLFMLMLVVEPLLALSVALVLGAAYGAIYVMARRYLRRIGQARMESNKERFKLVQEAFGGIKEVKIGNLEGVFLERFSEPSMKVARREIASRLVSELPSFLVQALVFGGVMVVLLYLLMTRGSLQDALPVFSLFMLAGYRMLPSLQHIYRDLAHMRFHTAVLDSMHRDLRDLSAPLRGPRETRADGRAPALGLQEGLTLDGVSYRYPGSARWALNDIRIAIPAHSRIGVVGPTGSGKSTLIDVVLGLLIPQRGHLAVDGRPVTDENRAAWQRSIGYVPQHIYLADDTVSGNIAFGVQREHIDPEAVERAARAANLHDFISTELPHGYETMIGERGVRLSGGQRQRLGIARALYGDPDVIVFDEATSALDNLTEKAVMEAVRDLDGRKTIILVAHRLGTVRECDRIFYLEDGRIAAEGTFDELLRNSPRFRMTAEAGG